MADDHVEQALAAIMEREADVAPAPEVTAPAVDVHRPVETPATTTRRTFRWRPVAAVLTTGAVAAAVLLAPSFLGGTLFSGSGQISEGVLGDARNNAAGGDPTLAAVPHASQGAASPANSDGEASPSVSLGFDFDAVRMGGGIGEGWVALPPTPDAVTVAAFPTAVDRSARLVVSAAEGTQACRPLDAALEVRRLRLDVLLDPGLPSIATVELRDPSGDALFTLSVDETQATLATHGQSVAEASGLEAGQWYAIEVTSQDPAGWRMAPLENSSAGVELDVPALALRSIRELCLRADGPIGAAISYNNVSMTN